MIKKYICLLFILIRPTIIWPLSIEADHLTVASAQNGAYFSGHVKIQLPEHGIVITGENCLLKNRQVQIYGYPLVFKDHYKRLIKARKLTYMQDAKHLVFYQQVKMYSPQYHLNAESIMLNLSSKKYYIKGKPLNPLKISIQPPSPL